MHAYWGISARYIYDTGAAASALCVNLTRTKGNDTPSSFFSSSILVHRKMSSIPPPIPQRALRRVPHRPLKRLPEPSKPRTSILSLPAELHDHIFSYLLPTEIHISHEGHAQRPSSRALTPILALIKTNSVLSRAATHALYTQPTFLFIDYLYFLPSYTIRARPDPASIPEVFLERIGRNLGLVRKIRFTMMLDRAERRLLVLLRAQERGMRLRELVLVPYKEEHLAPFAEGGMGRKIVCRMRGLRSFRFDCYAVDEGTMEVHEVGDLADIVLAKRREEGSLEKGFWEKNGYQQFL